MYYYSPTLFNSEYLYYLYLPPTPSVTPDNYLCEKQQTPLESTEKVMLSTLDEEKILLTKQDLQNEGYEQTKKSWTSAEDKLLLALCKDENARFEEIAARMEGRNAKMCYSRFRRLAYLTKIGWSKAQDTRLINLVEQFGQNWKLVAELFKGKTQKQLKEHYCNYLKPELIKSEWTLEEDLELVRLINKHGKNWKNIEEEFTGRSRSQIKNRFFGKITRLNKKKIEQMRTHPHFEQAQLIPI